MSWITGAESWCCPASELELEHSSKVEEEEEVKLQCEVTDSWGTSKAWMDMKLNQSLIS